MTDIHAFQLKGYALAPEVKERLKEASAVLKRLRRRRKKVVSLSDASGVTSWLADSFFQHGLYRIVTLADGIIGEWNARRPVNAIILARSLSESVASWNYVGGKILKLVKQNAIREIHQILMRMRFGIRHKLPGDVDLPTSTNVLTFIASLEKVNAIIDNLEVFAPTKDGRKMFRYYYDEMSEFVHPNEAGFGVFAVEADPGTMELRLSESQPTMEAHVVGKVLHVSILLSLADKFLDAYQDGIRGEIFSMEKRFGPRPSDWPVPL